MTVQCMKTFFEGLKFKKNFYLLSHFCLSSQFFYCYSFYCTITNFIKYKTLGIYFLKNNCRLLCTTQKPKKYLLDQVHRPNF